MTSVMRIQYKPKVYLVGRPSINEEGLQAFLDDNGLHWPTPTEGVKDAERLVEIAGRTCFDDQTDVLTCRGWLRFSDLLPDDQVMTMNRQTEIGEWQPINEIICKDFDGMLIQVNGRDVNMAVTQDHRQWYWTKDKPTPRYAETKDLWDIQFYVKTGLPQWNGSYPETVEIPDYTYRQSNNSVDRTIHGRVYAGYERIVAFAKLLTFYATEGSLTTRGLAIYGTKHVVQVADLCDTLDLPYHMGEDPRNGVKRIGVGGGQPVKLYVEEMCGHLGPNKQLPRWVLDLPKDWLAEIWDIMVDTDGFKYPNGGEVFLSSSKTLLNQAQEILAKLGYGSSLVYEGNMERGEGNHFKSSYPVYRVRKKRSITMIGRAQQMAYLPYKGKVWCVNVDNGTLLVRRDGKVHVSANCYMSYGAKAGSKTNRAYINNLLGRESDGTFRPGPAHGSVTEHPHWQFVVTGAGRGFSHELVRHRVGVAYSQLSTRYCDFEREEEEGTWDPGFCVPPLAQLDSALVTRWEEKFKADQEWYKETLHIQERVLKDNKQFMRDLADLSDKDRKRTLRKAARGATRDGLPIGTEAIMTFTANARAVWNMAYLRASEHAEGVIRDVFVQLVKIMEEEMPALFNTIVYEYVWDGSQAAILPRDKL